LHQPAVGDGRAGPVDRHEAELVAGGQRDHEDARTCGLRRHHRHRLLARTGMAARRRHRRLELLLERHAAGVWAGATAIRISNAISTAAASRVSTSGGSSSVAATRAEAMPAKMITVSHIVT